MKQFLLFLLMPILFAGCKKDKDGGRQLFLSKVYNDGLLKTEYTYSSDNRPARRNLYATNSGQSVLSGFRLYEYTQAGLLEKILDFNPNNQKSHTYKLHYDVNNKPTRMDHLTTDNTLLNYYVFEYNNSGKLLKYSLYAGATNKKNVEALFSYNAQGKPQTIKRYAIMNAWPTLYDSSVYVTGTIDLPQHWSYFEMLEVIGLPNGEKTFFEMILGSESYFMPGAPPNKSNTKFSDKQYGKDGYLIKQHVSREVTNVGPPVTTNYELTYAYVEL